MEPSTYFSALEPERLSVYQDPASYSFLINRKQQADIMIEKEPLAELHSYEILDTDEEFAFDDLTEFASKVLEVPYVFINLIDDKRQWAKSAAGVAREAAESDRNDSLCNLAIQKNAPLIIPDAQADDRFSDVGCVCNPPNVRFYAGMPIINENGYALGTVWLLTLSRGNSRTIRSNYSSRSLDRSSPNSNLKRK